MIAKKYRLKEREFGKVLSRRKPFFSYMFIANVLENHMSSHRCAILLSSKVTKGSVNRNFWRRQFYDISLPYLESCESPRPVSFPSSVSPGGQIPKTNHFQKHLDSSATNHRIPTFDIVFVPKKGTLLDHRDEKQLAEFKKNIQFAYKKILETFSP